MNGWIVRINHLCFLIIIWFSSELFGNRCFWLGLQIWIRGIINKYNFSLFIVILSVLDIILHYKLFELLIILAFFSYSINYNTKKNYCCFFFKQINTTEIYQFILFFFRIFYLLNLKIFHSTFFSINKLLCSLKNHLNYL